MFKSVMGRLKNCSKLNETDTKPQQPNVCQFWTRSPTLEDITRTNGDIGIVTWETALLELGHEATYFQVV